MSKEISNRKHFHYLSLFSGIGGFELGFQKAVKKNSKPGSNSTVSAIAKPIDTPAISMRGISSTAPSEISKPPSHRIYRSLISCAEDFLAKHFQSPESGAGSAIHAVRSSLKSLGLLGKHNHALYCLKTSKGYYFTIKDVPSESSSPRLMNWGMTVNGNCLTAKISACHKTVRGCSLSDILEEHPDRKYFLSSNQKTRLLRNMREVTARQERD